VFAAGFLMVNLALAAGQWDRDRVTFPVGSGVAVSLERGEQRITYMTAGRSGRVIPNPKKRPKSSYTRFAEAANPEPQPT
jgi:hypothetical protein